MKPDPATEARLFGKLAMRGVLPRDAVGELFAAAKAAAAAGQPVGLSSLALRRGLIDKERLLPSAARLFLSLAQVEIPPKFQLLRVPDEVSRADKKAL